MGVLHHADSISSFTSEEVTSRQTGPTFCAWERIFDRPEIVRCISPNNLKKKNVCSELLIDSVANFFIFPPSRRRSKKTNELLGRCLLFRDLLFLSRCNTQRNTQTLNRHILVQTSMRLRESDYLLSFSVPFIELFFSIFFFSLSLLCVCVCVSFRGVLDQWAWEMMTTQVFIFYFSRRR